ncbi:MAG: hypothetical protein GEV11_23705 [Streptosporangiales bacterium]|nr:hypothetical protein [Streptosporangiales bacterium]
MFRRSRRVAGIAVAVFALVPAAAGCATGFGAQTNQSYQPVDGFSTTAPNGLGVRNTFVLGPVPGQRLAPRADAPLFITLVNESGRPDRLTEITTQAARRVPLPDAGVPLPAHSVTPATSSPTSRFVLRGLTRELLGGETLRVTLKFEKGGTLTADVPVMARGDFYTTYSPAPEPTQPGGAGTATPRPGATGDRTPRPGATNTAEPGATSTPESGATASPASRRGEGGEH